MRFLNILILVLLTTGALRSQIVTCDIFDLAVNIGDCTSDSTFKLSLDFQVANPSSDSFEVWTINNQYLGAYALADLPVGASLQEFQETEPLAEHGHEFCECGVHVAARLGVGCDGALPRSVHPGRTGATSSEGRRTT